MQSLQIPPQGMGAAAQVATALEAKRHAQTSRTTAKDSAGSGDKQSSSATTTGDITSSDFLTLLVSELKNQDPTQPTDPNAYITQLVGVNSLEQLIQINSGLSGIEGTAVDTIS